MSDKNFGRDSTIIHMWNENYTGSQIAAELGVTRNVVMGVLHRYRCRGLVGRKILAPVKPAPTKPRRKSVPKIKEKPIVYVEGKVKFADLHQSRQCHYIVNDGPPSEYLFCGKPQEKGSYCAHHASICYMPPRQR